MVSDGAGENPPVDSSGELPDGRHFTDAASFKKLLAGDLDRFNAVFIEKLATFALRRPMTLDDRTALAEIAKDSKSYDYRLRDLLESFVTSDLFRKR